MRSDPFARAFDGAAEASPGIRRESWWSPAAGQAGVVPPAGDVWPYLLFDPATAGGLTKISAAVPEPEPKQAAVLTSRQQWALGVIGVGFGVLLYRKTTG